MGLDVAYEHYFGKSGVASMSAFARRIGDVTVQYLYLQDGVWITSPFNNGVARVRGIEMELKFPLRSWFIGAPEIDLRANAARNWSTIEAVPGPDNRLASQVPSTLNLGIDYRLSPVASMRGNLNLQTGGGGALLDAHAGSYTGMRRTVDAFALWQLDGKTRVRLSLANLLHQRQVQGLSYANADGLSESAVSKPGSMLVRLMVEHSL